MAQKHKEAILQILKHSGPLPSATLKTRIMDLLDLDNTTYAKSSYQRHLELLIDEGKIAFIEESKKRTYYIEDFKHPINGGLILVNLGGQIHVPKSLISFEPQISLVNSPDLDPKRIHFLFEMNSTSFRFTIHADVIPFNLHISRATDSQNSEEIENLFGSRTISLTLPVNKLSSFKPGSQSGALLINFTDHKSKIILRELQATNPPSVITLENQSLDLVIEALAVYSTATVNNEIKQRTKSFKDERVLLKNEVLEVSTPSLIKLANECLIAIL